MTTPHPRACGQERPVIFSGPMVQALLAGRKTQTRRVLGTRGRNNIFAPGAWSDDYVMDPGNVSWRHRDTPYGVGDRLYVRETWAYWPAQNASSERDNVIYRADDDDWECRMFDWRPSIHMPRWASRLTLIVTDVRVERLQDISEADAVAEGMSYVDGDGWEARSGFIWAGRAYHGAGRTKRFGGGLTYHVPAADGRCRCNERGSSSAQCAYRELWNSLHGPDAWIANPWVVAVTFTVHRANIDALTPSPVSPPGSTEVAT